MPFVNSSAISRVEYVRETQTLQIWFVQTGGPYSYFNVPEQIYAELLAANSVGTYFNLYIRDRYSSNR